MRKDYLECGIIVNTHGVRGEMKLQSLCDSPEVLASLERVFMKKGDKYIEKEITRASVFKQFVLFDLAGISDMDTALALKNTVVYADREDFELEEGDFFIADIIGCDVIDADNGKVYGKLSEIINRGASDIYVVKTEKGEAMIPAVDEFIDRVEVGEAVYVRPISGMFD
jgi:16S rRNA processing protein RimM